MTASFARCNSTRPAKTRNRGQGAALNKKQIPAPAALFGYSHLYGGVPGGQAEYVRVPKGNVGPFKVPQLLSDDKALFLSDILPTAWQAAQKCADSERLQRRRIRGRAGGATDHCLRAASRRRADFCG